MIPQILRPTLQQERLPGAPATVDADDERHLLTLDDPGQAVGDLLALEHVVDPRALRVNFGFDHLEGRRFRARLGGLSLLGHSSTSHDVREQAGDFLLQRL